MRRIIVPIFIIIIVVGFFGHLFFPTLSVFATPDFGQSDIWSLNMPAKFFLSESLKRGELPLWNKDIGAGYPILAEGQIGTFYIVNLLLFRILPFFWAWNIGYVVTFFTAAAGTYLYAKKIGLSAMVSWYSSLVFSFSGVFITHISHYNLIQTASLLPWLFWAGEYMMEAKLWAVLAFAIILSQQIFAGFPQLAFISLIGVLTVVCVQLALKDKLKRFKAKVALLVGLATVLGVLLASVQLLPQYELLRSSVRVGGLAYNEATYFSYPWKHLQAFVSPFVLGDPRKGTYPPFAQFDGSIFWENTGYIGIGWLIFAFIGIFAWKKYHHVRAYVLLLLLGLLLMTGKYSPLYLVFSFPPFSFFRVPSRFIILFVWSLVILAGFGLQGLISFINHKLRLTTNIPAIFFGSLACIDLFIFAFSYNPTVPLERWNLLPEVAGKLRSKEGRFTPFGNEYAWNDVFVKDGWKNMDSYLYFRNALQANSNMFYDLSNLSLYPALLTRRLDALRTVLESNISFNSPNATVSATGVKFLRLFNTATIISPWNIHGEGIELGESIKPPRENLPEYKLYTIKHPLPLVYFSSEATSAATVAQVVSAIWKSTFEEQPPVVLEAGSFAKEKNENKQTNISVREHTHQKLVIDTTTDIDGFLVVSQSYFPGWEARVDGKIAEILPTNINQQSITLPSGMHQVIFSYQPKSLQAGLIISIVSQALTLVALGVCLLGKYRLQRFKW